MIDKANYYTPNDNNIMSYDDSASIQNAIDIAIFKGVNKVVIPRFNRRTKSTIWTITRSICLPTNITIILDNSYLVMADGVYENAFRNSGVITKKYGEANTVSEIYGVEDQRQYNIIIRGEGFACIDGGKSNKLLERNFEQEGLPHNINNNIIYFKNVENFEISNIAIVNQRWWAINFHDCSFGKVCDIYFDARNTIPNQDGIDIRPGCHDILVQRISGVTGDDFVALHAFNQGLTYKEGGERKVGSVNVPSNIKDVRDVNILDLIGTSNRQAVIALRNNYYTDRMYNINIENVIQSDNGDKNNFPYSANIRITTFDTSAKKDSPIAYVNNLNVKNLLTPVHTAFVLNGNIEDSCFENIRQIDGWTPFFVCDNLKVKNLKVNGLRVGKGVSAELLYTRSENTNKIEVKNFEIENATIDNQRELTNIIIKENIDIKVDGEKLC